MSADSFRLPRGGVLALAVVVATVLAWRVLVVGGDAFSERGPGMIPPPAATGVLGTDAPWRERLARNPTDARALVFLARELEGQGRRDEADAAVRQALRMAPADRSTLKDAAEFLRQTGSERSALRVMKRLVDLYPADGDAVWPIFTTIAASGSANEFFDRTAGENPAWWQPFMRYACDRSSDPAGLGRMMTVRLQAAVLADDERRCVVARLQRDGRWSDAHQLWRATAPGENQDRGGVYNGGFELPMSNLGFDWILPVRDGVTAGAQPVEGAIGKRALQVAFAGKRPDGPPVYQQLMLGPGAYRLALRGRADGMDSAYGAQWGMYCVAPPSREPQLLMRGDRLIGSFGWMDFRYDFKVPNDCPVQALRLESAYPRHDAAMAGSGAAPLRGTLYFDEISVRPRG